MPVNIYDQPFQAQYMNTYVPMPYQEILQAGAMKQERHDLSEELREDLDDQLMQSSYLKWSKEDAAMVKQKQAEFAESINSKLDEVGGDYGAILPFIKAQRRKYQREVTTGQLGKAADNYKRYWDNYEEEKKRLKEGKINENSFKTQRAKERASYHGVGDVGSLADIELEYAVLNQDIQEEVFKVAGALEAMNSNEIGEWALRTLPSGHELLERTDFKVSKLSPNTIYELANAAVRNNPELQPYLEERAGLKVWEAMEEARNTPGGFEELASSALKLSEEDIVEGMQIAGYDPNNPIDRENYLEYKYKEALKDNIVSDQALIASGVFAQNDRIETRETRVPSDSDSRTGGLSSQEYLEGMILTQGNDFISQSAEGISIQEKVIKDTDKDILELENQIENQKKILEIQDNPDTRNKLEELESQHQILSAKNEAIKNNIDQAYRQLGISTEDIDKIVEDRINIYRADQMKKNNQGQRIDNPLTAIDESNQKTWEDPETGEIYYLDPVVFNQIETNAGFQQISIRNQIEAERKEALEKAMEDPNFKVTKTPYLFTAADAGKGYAPIGNINTQNSLIYKNTNGSGWSLVLNGSSDAGLAANDVVEDFIKENSGTLSDGVEGYKPTGETFIYSTNQVDNAGNPVYQLGIEGEKDGNTKIIKSFQVTNGAVKIPEFTKLAVALAQSNIPKYQQMGDQMLADLRLAPHLRSINLHTMNTKEVRSIPGLKDPVTKKELKVLKDGREYVVVYNDPEGDIKIPGKETTYSAFTPKAGGEEDLYIKLYDELQGTEQELAEDNLKSQISERFWNPREETDIGASILPSENEEEYRKRVAIEALSLPKEIAPEGINPVSEETFENINLSDSLYGPAAQPVMIDFLKELDDVFKEENREVELGGLFRTRAYNNSLKNSAKTSLHTVGLGADFLIQKNSAEHKRIAKYIKDKNYVMKRGNVRYKIEHDYHQGHLHIELTPSI